MKRLIDLCLLLLIVALAACGGKRTTPQDDARVLMQDSTDVHGLQRMQASTSEVQITLHGREYHSTVSRVADDELPHVVSEMGDTYVDNKIVLRLRRGGEDLFQMTFTKHHFAALVGEEFLAKSILEGIVYTKTTAQGIVYAASVCYPQTDLYVPIAITITADGKMSMEKVEALEDAYAAEDVP